jgi:hypothetical protein
VIQKPNSLNEKRNRQVDSGDADPEIAAQPTEYTSHCITLI